LAAAILSDTSPEEKAADYALSDVTTGSLQRDSG
jgi:hypothetical protein